MVASKPPCAALLPLTVFFVAPALSQRHLFPELVAIDNREHHPALILLQTKATGNALDSDGGQSTHDDNNEGASSDQNVTDLCSDFDAQANTKAAVEAAMNDVVNVTGDTLNDVILISTSINTSVNNLIGDALEAVSTLHEALDTAAQMAEKLGDADFVVDLADTTLKLVENVNKTGILFVRKVQIDLTYVINKATSSVVKLVRSCETAVEKVFANSGNQTIWPEVQTPSQSLIKELLPLGQPSMALVQSSWPNPFKQVQKTIHKFAPRGGGSLKWDMLSAGDCSKAVDFYEKAMSDLKNSSREILNDVGNVILKYVDKFAAKATASIEKQQEEQESGGDDEKKKKSSGGWGNIVGQMSDAAYSAAIKGITTAVDKANSTIRSMIDDAVDELVDVVSDQVDSSLEKLGLAGELALAVTCQAEAALGLGAPIHGAMDSYYVSLCTLPSYDSYLLGSICPDKLEPGAVGCFVSGPLREGSCAKGSFLIPRGSGGKLVQTTVTYSVEPTSVTELGNDASASADSEDASPVVATLSLPEEAPMSGILIVAVSSETASNGTTWNITSVDGCNAAVAALGLKPDACK